MNNLIPVEWIKAIFLIPKLADSDPHLSLKYRGISLLCCIYKIYTNILNRKISKCVVNRQVPEQCEFCKGKSCLDQIYVLDSVLRNRSNENKDTFVAMIDLKNILII